jgi:hypothetical protein
MEIKEFKVKGYNCKSKKLLVVDGEPVVLADSSSRISIMIQYIQGYIADEEIKDGSVLKLLKPLKERWTSENGSKK